MNVENVAGIDVEMIQATDYPWSGKVSITVNPKVRKNFSIRIRVPNRSVSSLYTSTTDSNSILSLAVNGSAVKPKIGKGYAVITRTWKSGDKIGAVFPMKVQRVRASDKIVADRGRVALRYGPLVYNIEAVDQDIAQIPAPESALTPEWKGDLLGGVMVIKGAFANGATLMAIPNYARYNRMPAAAAGAPPVLHLLNYGYTLCIVKCMRTNIVLNDDLVREAMRYSTARSKRELVDDALRTLVRVRAEERRRQSYRDRLSDLERRLRGLTIRESSVDLLRQDREGR